MARDLDAGLESRDALFRTLSLWTDGAMSLRDATAVLHDEPANTLTVYFDGECPVCSREIAVYRREPASDRILWVDASRCSPERLGPGLDRPTALAQLHVRSADGTLVAGAGAFAALWSRLPAFSRLGRIASDPRVTPWLDKAYSIFLSARRWWRRPASELPAALLADLRTDHAGETGAVMIYRGILSITHDSRVRRFALRHLAAEKRHLAAIGSVLPAARRSRLLFLWWASGWLTGAMPALAGPRAVFATVEAVETFVDRHYARKIERIDQLDSERRDAGLQALRALLDSCRMEEVSHRDEAAERLDRPVGIALRSWSRLVAIGSAVAVAISRKV